MGLLGSQLGKAIGGGIGGKYGGNTGKEVGSILGSAAGALLPFKKGGKVVKKTQPALLHKGEVVIPSRLAKKIPASLKKEMKKGGARNM